eukprot:5367988-Alexandrium_andersonii.AAC.1
MPAAAPRPSLRRRRRGRRGRALVRGHANRLRPEPLTPGNSRDSPAVMMGRRRESPRKVSGEQ